MQTKLDYKPICGALPNKNKQNPFINFSQIPINQNFLENTADIQISRQKSSINQYALPRKHKSNPWITCYNC